MGKQSKMKHYRKQFKAVALPVVKQNMPAFKDLQQQLTWLNGYEAGSAAMSMMTPELLDTTIKIYTEYMVLITQIKEVISRIDNLIQNRNNFIKQEPYKAQLITLRGALGDVGLRYESAALAVYQEYGVEEVNTELGSWKATISYIVDEVQRIIGGQSDGSKLASAYASLLPNNNVQALIEQSLKRNRGRSVGRLYVGRRAFELETDEAEYQGKGGMQRAGQRILNELESSIAENRTPKQHKTHSSAFEWLKQFRSDERRLGQEVSAAKRDYCQELA